MVKDKKENNFAASPPLQVIIPYSEYEKVVNMAQKVEEIERLYVRLQEQYTAIRGMFSECLMEIRNVKDFVKDS